MTTFNSVLDATKLSGFTSGLDAERPVARAGLVGSFFYATDTGMTYRCRSSTRWDVCDIAQGSDRVTYGPFDDSPGKKYWLADWNHDGAAPRCGTGDSFACIWRMSLAPVTDRHIFVSSDGSGRGTVVQLILSGGVAMIRVYLLGLAGSPFLLTGTPVTLDTPHCTAFTVTGGNLRYSHNGGAVAALAVGAGAYVPPNATDQVVVGRSNGAGYDRSFVEGQLGSILVWESKVLTDPQLVSVASDRANYRIVEPKTNTATFGWEPRHIPDGDARAVCRGGIVMDRYEHVRRNVY